MSAKFLGPFINEESGEIYRSYVNFSNIMTIESFLDGEPDDASYVAIRTIPAGYDSGSDSMSLIEFSFYTEDGQDLQPDVDRGYLRFLNRNLINVLTSRPDDVVVPVDYPIGLQAKNIYIVTDYA
jgi:hypothetical protein